MRLPLPDGVVLSIPIEAMVVKDSIFIPTLMPDKLRDRIQRVAESLNFRLSTNICVVEGYFGLLVTRRE